MIVSIGCSVAVMRTTPAGLSRKSDSATSCAVISSMRGATAWNSASPASVVDTLRVVRVSSRTPTRASRSRMVWLSADCDTPSRVAARVKLRSRATAKHEQVVQVFARHVETLRSGRTPIVAPPAAIHQFGS